MLYLSGTLLVYKKGTSLQEQVPFLCTDKSVFCDIIA